METYKPELIGKRISHGRAHIIYHYGENEIIKIPWLEKWIWPKLKERLERDISVCKKYFCDYYLDTRIVQDPSTGRIATIQPYIAGHYLSKSDMSDPELKRQFQEILKCQESLILAGYAPVDLIGQSGYRRRLSNLMVTNDKKIKLFDAVIGDAAYLEHGKFIFPLVKRIILYWQNSVIRYFLS